jgi:hypothetical protein
MRNNTQLLGVLLTAGALTAGALTIGAVQATAAEPQPLRNGCRTTSQQSSVPCVAAKPVRAVQQQAPMRAAGAIKAGLDRNVCSRLQTQLERDTCLNRVEATA